MPSRCCKQTADVGSLDLQMVIDTHPEKMLLASGGQRKSSLS